MAARVTIQDIADALGVSRNTVSKAINNTGILADTTREKVLKKAAEMGYKQFSYVTTIDSKPVLTIANSARKTEIALLTTMFLGNSHFASTMLDKFQRELSQLGYSFTMHRILPSELERFVLPDSLNLERTAGIICIEVFDLEYSKMICNLETPVLFVDSPVTALHGALKADCLYMENQSNIFYFINEMVKRGKTRIGFVGEYMHCQSFFERYIAYRNALYLLGLPCPEEYCIIQNKEGVAKPNRIDYQEYLIESFQKIDLFPEVLICANDFIALDTIQAIKNLGYVVPKDVYLCGFDDSPESRVITPLLTTIHIHCQIMGVTAVQLLMSRINEPSMNYRTIYTETSMIFRESTED